MELKGMIAFRRIDLAQMSVVRTFDD